MEEPAPKRRRGRRLVLLLAFVLLVALFVLGTAPGQKWLFEVVAQRVERASGWQVSAEQVRLGFGLTVDLGGVEIHSPDGMALARAKRVRARASLRGLRGEAGLHVLERVVVRDLWLDPSALPATGDHQGASTSPDWAVEVRSVELAGARLEQIALREPLRVALGGLELSAVGADSVSVSGSFTVGSALLADVAIDGNLTIDAAGLRPDEAAVSASLRWSERGLSIEDLNMSTEGGELRGSLACQELLPGASLTEGVPCRLEASLRSELPVLLSAESFAVPDSSFEAEAAIDLGTWLGQVEARLRNVPLEPIRLASLERGLQDGTFGDKRELTEIIDALLLDGRVSYQAAATDEGAEVAAQVQLEGLDASIPSRRLAVVELDGRGGALDPAGRIDLRRLDLTGSIEVADERVARFLPLLPSNARDAVGRAGWASEPIALSGRFESRPSEEADGSVELTVGKCADASLPKCRLRLRVPSFSVVVEEGSPQWHSLQAAIELDAKAVPAASLLRLATDSDGRPELVEGIRAFAQSRRGIEAGRSDLGAVDIALETRIDKGRVLEDAVAGSLQWRGPDAVEFGATAAATEVLWQAAAAAKAPASDQAARLQFRTVALPGLDGERQVIGELSVGRIESGWSVVTESEALVEGRVLPLVERLRPLLEGFGWDATWHRALELYAADARLEASAALAGPFAQLALSHQGELNFVGGDRMDWTGGKAVSAACSGDQHCIEADLEIADASRSRVLPLVAAALLSEPEPPSWLPSVGSIDASGLLVLGETPRIDVEADALFLRVFDRPVDRITLRIGQQGGSVGRWAVHELSVLTPGTESLVRGLVGWNAESGPLLDLQVSGSASRYQVDQLSGRLTLGEAALLVAPPPPQMRPSSRAMRADQLLQFRTTQLSGREGEGSISLDLPLGALAAFEELREPLRSLGVTSTQAPVELALDLPIVRVQAVDEDGLAEGPVPVDRAKNFLEFERLTASGSLLLNELDRARLELGADRLTARYAEYEIASTDPLRAEMTSSNLRFAPLRLQPRSTYAGTAARSDITWQAAVQFGQIRSLASLGDSVRRVESTLRGPIDLVLLQRFLSPARADGLAQLDAQVHGPPSALSGTLEVVSLDGPIDEGASIQLIAPYVTRFSDLDLRATLDRGALQIEQFEAQLNEGELQARGRVSRQQVDLAMDLQGVRYRVDYGLSTEISGDLSLNLPLEQSGELEGPARRGSLKGSIQVERGLARREVDLDRELRNLLFAPTATSGGVDPLADLVDLDLTVTTAEGLRVRNNVADVRATWDELRVRGTLAEPLLAGTVEAEPGGIVTAYGQVARIDRGELRFSGQPGVAPDVELDTTNSIEDPTIRRNSALDLDPFSSGGFEAATRPSLNAQEAFTGGLADYVGSELGDNLGQAFGGLFNVRPVLVFGETEPTARLIVTRELTDNLDIGVSLALRGTEERLYLLDLHDLPIARSLSTQLFTNEQGNQGATLQQSLELGGKRRSPLRVGDIRFQIGALSEAAQERFSERKLRRELSVEPGDEWFDSVPFDTEVDVVDSLRDSRFPSPEVKVVVEERGRRRDLVIQVEPGDPVEIEFEGLRPAKVYRAAIRLSYRSDFFEQASLREMRQQTQTALEAEGWVDVRVWVERIPAARRPDSAIELVLLHSEASRKVSAERLAIEGLDTEGALAVESALASRGARVALAQGDETAEERVVDALASLGWFDAQLKAARLSEDGETLELDFERGRRARIADIRLVGVDESRASAREVLALAGGDLLIAPGDPVVERELARAAIQIEDRLRDRGYSQASVSARSVRTDSGGDPWVEVQVSAGTLNRVADITVQSEGMSSPSWVRQQIAIEPGDVYDRSKLRASRSRLLGTGVFSRVSFETVEAPADDPIESSTEDVRLSVLLRERPRWSVAYGLRWESDEGLGTVVDVQDRNVAGRGLQLGGRALWTEPRQAARLIAGVPRLFGSPISLDAFGELRQVDRDGVESEVAEATLQLSVPLSERWSGRSYVRYRVDEEFDPAQPTSRVRTETPVVGLQLAYDVRSRGTERGLALTDFAGTSGTAAALYRGLEGGLGTFASLDLSTSNESLGGDFDFLRAFVQVFHSRDAFELAGRRVVWAQSARAGWIDNRGSPLPREQRFFAGGEYSVRGYGREALGPQGLVDGERSALGGEAVLVINQELRAPLVDQFEGVLLFDAGNVWADPDDAFDEILTSAGLGLRYRSPFGLLRLDVAFPLERREEDDSVRFYLGFGHVF